MGRLWPTRDCLRPRSGGPQSSGMYHDRARDERGDEPKKFDETVEEGRSAGLFHAW